MNTDQRAERFSTWGVDQRSRLLRARRRTTVRPRSKKRPTASTGAPATTSCSPPSARVAIAIPPVISSTRRAAPTTRTAPPQRQSACDLEIGTSTGVLGLRKFPNPRFDRARWRALNGRPGHAGRRRSRARLDDGSVEPPFLIGMSCGACHIAFNPLKPPTRSRASAAGRTSTGWIGNQYSRFSELLASGHAARQASSGRSSRTHGPAPSTRPPCRTTASTTPARSTRSSTCRSGRRTSTTSSSGAR